MPRNFILLSDAIDPGDGLEVERFNDTLIFTTVDNPVVMLDEDNVKRLRREIELLLGTNMVRDLYNARDYIKTLEQENRELQALVQTLAEGKDKLRREIDHLERENA